MKAVSFHAHISGVPRLTDQNDHKGLFVFDHLHDAAEQSLDELSRLGKPAREQGVRVDLE